MTKGKLSPLELVAEHIKCLGNLRMEYLKRFCDRRPIIEPYMEGEVTLHIHARSAPGRWCLTYVRNKNDIGPCDEKASMLVRIGESFQHARPLATLVRLQRLDNCLVYDRNSFKRGITPTIPVLFRVFDRKLCSLLDLARIEDSKFIDKIIKCSTEVIDALPNQDRDDWWEILKFSDSDRGGAGSGYIWLRGEPVLRKQGRNLALQIAQVLVCPTYSRIGIVKGWLAGIGLNHERETSDSKDSQRLLTIVFVSA